MMAIARLCRPMVAVAAASEAGFTLIEMIVSLAILSIALGVLLAAFSRDLDRQQRDRDQTQARLLATSLLDQNTTDVKLVTRKGVMANGLAWSVSATPYGSDADRKAWRFSPAQVTVTVHWLLDGQTHNLSLRTLRPMAAERDR